MKTRLQTSEKGMRTPSQSILFWDWREDTWAWEVEISDLRPSFRLLAHHLFRDWEAERDWVTARNGDGVQGGQEFLPTAGKLQRMD